MIGSIVGTLGGYEFRVRLVKAIGGKDFPIALLEDLIAAIDCDTVSWNPHRHGVDDSASRSTME